MAAYYRVYGFGHRRADCRGPGLAAEPCARFDWSMGLHLPKSVDGTVKDRNFVH